MATLFPAVLIAGPEHADVTRLAQQLHQALEDRDVRHYLRHASGQTMADADTLAGDIQRRHLPLLAGVSGGVGDENRKLAAQCSHAVVLAAEPDDLSAWRDLAEASGLLLLAELRSNRRGVQMVEDDGATLRGIITGLDPQLSPDGVCFDALAERVAAVFDYPPEELERACLSQTEVDLPLNLERPIPPLPAHSREASPWRPDELPALLESLPQGVSLGLYGHAPNWLYGALAALAFPQPVELFDVQLGWIAPPLLTESDQTDPRLAWEATSAGDVVQLRFRLATDGLEPDRAEGLAVPPVAGRGVILDDEMPTWLVAALARHACQSAAWIALSQPQLRGCVVMWSSTDVPPIGALIQDLV